MNRRSLLAGVGLAGIGFLVGMAVADWRLSDVWPEPGDLRYAQGYQAGKAAGDTVHYYHGPASIDCAPFYTYNTSVQDSAVGRQIEYLEGRYDFLGCLMGAGVKLGPIVDVPLEWEAKGPPTIMHGLVERSDRVPAVDSMWRLLDLRDSVGAPR